MNVRFVSIVTIVVGAIVGAIFGNMTIWVMAIASEAIASGGIKYAVIRQSTIGIVVIISDSCGGDRKDVVIILVRITDNALNVAVGKIVF